MTIHVYGGKIKPFSFTWLAGEGEPTLAAAMIVYTGGMVETMMRESSHSTPTNIIYFTG
jgi:hypothetical protein